MKNATKEFIDIMLTEDSRINEQLKRNLPLTVINLNKPSQFQRIRVNSETVEGTSRKPTNVFLNFPLFIKVICETIIDGIHAYHIPFLLFPAFIKLLISTKELASIELTKTQAAILIGLYNLSTEAKNLQIDFKELFLETKKIVKYQHINDNLNEKDYDKAIEDLVKAKCIAFDDDKKIRIKERIELIIK